MEQHLHRLHAWQAEQPPRRPHLWCALSLIEQPCLWPCFYGLQLDPAYLAIQAVLCMSLVAWILEQAAGQMFLHPSAELPAALTHPEDPPPVLSNVAR